MSQIPPMFRPSPGPCLLRALGCCAILTHNVNFYMERPGEPCVYSAPCNPRQPLADMPEPARDAPEPGSRTVMMSGTVGSTTISSITSIGPYPYRTI